MKRIALVVLVLATMTACGTTPSADSPSVDPLPTTTDLPSIDDVPTDDYTPPPPDPNAGKVTFKITSSGAGRANFITYSPNGTSMAQVTGAHLPWSKTMDYGSSGIVVLNAQNTYGGTITCEIDADGSQIDKQTASGQYAMVQCSGDIPGAGNGTAF